MQQPLFIDGENRWHAMPRVWPSVVHMLAHAVATDPARQALVFGELRMSYAQLGGCVSALCEELRVLGLGAQQRIAVLMHNSADMVVAIFAVQALGAQLVPLNPAYTESELGPMLDAAGCSAIVHDAGLAPRLSRLLDGFDAARRISVGDGPGQRRLAHCRRPAQAAALALPGEHALALLLYTGGTTGRSKGVELTHGAVAVNASQRDALLAAREGCERFLIVTPLFHAYALATCFSAVFSRGTVVLMEKYQPHRVLQLIAEEGITILAGSSTIFTGLLACDGLAQARLGSLRCSYSGSAALSPQVLGQWERRSGSAVVEGYGQTEAGPVLTYNPLHGLRKIGSVGVALPLTEIQIVDLDTGEQVLGPGAIGEIRARGPQLMRGYRGLPEETSAVLKNGWLYTGDVGEVDADGYVYVRDRKKDMVIVSGFNVYPREVEDAICSHPLVRESAVVGVPDSYRGEALVAFVVPSSVALQESALLAHLAQRLVKYKLPTAWHFIDALPLTAIGKPDKPALRRQWLRCAAAVSPPPAERSPS